MDAITATVPIKGVQTEVELVAGKMGKVYAYRADNGQHLWTRPVGKHQNDTGLLPRKPINVFPGIFGGVETPMALAANRLFVPWLNFPTRASATGIAGGLGNFKTGTGGLTAIDPGAGKVLWQNKLPSEDFGAATVANDVVFTSTYAGTIRLRHEDGQDALDEEGVRRHQLLPGDRRRHLAGWRRRSRVLQEPALRVDRLLAVGDRRGECARSAGSRDD